MADLNIERKHGPLLWPWLIGLVVLALLMWGIAELVNTDRDNSQMAQSDSTNAGSADTTAPAPVAGSAAPAAEQSVGVTPLGALVPLGVQHAGQRVTAAGQVLSKPAHGGFWLRSEGNAVVWVESSQNVTPGQQVQDLTGTLERPLGSEAAEWTKDLPENAVKGAGTQVTTDVFLDAAGDSGPTATQSARAAGKAGTRARQGTRGRHRVVRAG